MLHLLHPRVPHVDLTQRILEEEDINERYQESGMVKWSENLPLERPSRARFSGKNIYKSILRGINKVSPTLIVIVNTLQ